MRAIPERFRSVFTTRRYTNPHLPFTLQQKMLTYEKLVENMKTINYLQQILKLSY